MACVRDVPPDAQGKQHSELRIFDLGDDNALTVAPVQGYCVKDALSPSVTTPCAALEYDYSIADSAVEPRILSNSGEWLAFSASAAGGKISYLYLADLRAKPFHLSVKAVPITLDSDTISTSKLAFAPDGTLLLRQLGRVLTACSVSGPGAGLPVRLWNFDVDAPDSNPICSEDSASAPDRWCGSAERDAPFKWAPSSKYVAYRSKGPADAETLTIADLTQLPTAADPLSSTTDDHAFSAPRCNAKCSGQFAFQP
jgi:hypothetical protein